MNFPVSAIREAVATLLGWTVVIALTLLVGFCAGYWIGHREVTGIRQTATPLARIPLLWLGFQQMFIAYGVTALAWYLPLHFESGWLKVGSAFVNLLTWLVVVYSVVEQSAHAKFFRY